MARPDCLHPEFAPRPCRLGMNQAHARSLRQYAAPDKRRAAVEAAPSWSQCWSLTDGSPLLVCRANGRRGMKHPRPLEGVVVVELGHSVAAPYAGLILADLGARVIKVENPEHGDYARGWGPPFWGDTASVYAALNRGKESITVDFADPDQAAGLRRLIIEQADGVIQNLRPGILDSLRSLRGIVPQGKAVIDMVRHRRVRRQGADVAQTGLRSAGTGLHRHHERDRRRRPAAGPGRDIAGRYGLRHVDRARIPGGVHFADTSMATARRFRPRCMKPGWPG